MKFFILSPEVAGGIGENSIIHLRDGRRSIAKLHYEFDVWLGDPLLETVGFYIVTDDLKQKIERLKATGVIFDNVEVSKSELFEDLYSNRQLPRFWWLKLNGVAGKDDFGSTAESSLVVSERVLDLLQRNGVTHCEVENYEPV